MSRKITEQEGEEEKDLQYDYYYAVFYNDVEEVKALREQGAKDDYKIPGKNESVKELAERLNKDGKLSFSLKEILLGK